MRNFILALVLTASAPAFAGKVKEIYIMTEESVMETLGVDESVIQIERFQFVHAVDADLAVETEGPYFKCLTLFEKSGQRFQVVKTTCALTK